MLSTIAAVVATNILSAERCAAPSRVPILTSPCCCFCFFSGSLSQSLLKTSSIQRWTCRCHCRRVHCCYHGILDRGSPRTCRQRLQRFESQTYHTTSFATCHSWWWRTWFLNQSHHRRWWSYPTYPQIFDQQKLQEIQEKTLNRFNVVLVRLWRGGWHDEKGEGWVLLFLSIIVLFGKRTNSRVAIYLTAHNIKSQTTTKKQIKINHNQI